MCLLLRISRQINDSIFFFFYDSDSLLFLSRIYVYKRSLVQMRGRQFLNRLPRVKLAHARDSLDIRSWGGTFP